ncbi:unnamed protein product [Dibothriocephalus latus]|uniref:Uncharacterized protein n=1 Tax=Dibothriocephalus latus TaxID=60516 RepID=A0A3P7P047_DIBLA|nr:unnamed protein product [Dibothriocephalus latus]
MRTKRVSMDFRHLVTNHAHAEANRNSKRKPVFSTTCGDESVGSADCEHRSRLLQASKLDSRDGAPPAFIYNLPLQPVKLSNPAALNAIPVKLPKCSVHAGMQGVSMTLDRIPRSVERRRMALPAQLSPLVQSGDVLATITTNSSIAADTQTTTFDVRRTRHPMWPIYEVMSSHVLSTPVTTANSAEVFTTDVV